MNLIFSSLRLGVFALLILQLSACNSLIPKPTPQPAFYSLDNAGAQKPRPQTPLKSSAPSLIVIPVRAAAGFDSQRIIYVREAHKLEYFAHSEWVDTPARMLLPLIVSELEASDSFRVVLSTPSAAAGELRLDAEILRLQHMFGTQPSSVRFTLRVTVVDNVTRKVIAWREFDESVAAASEDPYGGVVAANGAVHLVLQKLASFCTETASEWKPVISSATQH